ncbi:MAG: arginine--tRNA ligase, partial [Planctomycetes bacterium]|nr:arginine--tRNA ligase [Planctomycetota bacterium]
PLIIRKSDGGFGYATTDLAALKYRFKKWVPGESFMWSGISKSSTSPCCSRRWP